ncbi:HNH endonuclease family protein [Cryobacterium sp. PH29-G1]|uniref:HNH endonuclease family protein n=1 Tax=Cryobacterium sp. PH29-G1 TaxID=3046211 RepID=UPI0024BA7E84|nr:HNH endonuclease family protein [Cryobacterium sp. PH29-G1]MDJ0349630.1 HNH endonuclease family protein [Cryobacterium sp. PH29-G1]
MPWSEFIDTGNRKTTEHVLPQNPAPDSDWWNTFSQDEHKQLHHTLGNLVLTYDNSSYSNKDYAAKRGVIDQYAPPCYYTASLAQERELASWVEWTPVSIIERQHKLASWAMERWGVARPDNMALQQAEVEVADEVEAAVASDPGDFEEPT